MSFEFATAGRIIFGRGALAGVGPVAASLGSRVLVTCGRDRSRAAALLVLLEAAGLTVLLQSVAGEPSFGGLRAALAEARDFRPDLLVGFGGGSALDEAKALAALLANGGDPLDYAEVIGKGLPLARPSLPLIAIPTTAGTGTEVSRNAVLSSSEEGVKVSLRSPTMLPTVALVDPDLTLGLPPRITADSGLDALTQLVEPFTSAKATPLVDALCREGIARSLRSLRRAFASGSDAAAREDLALASLLGGMALANAGLGAVHGLAGPLGGLTGSPHGALCGALLPHVVSANARALLARAPASPVLARYAELAVLADGAGGARAEAAEAGPALARFALPLAPRRLRELGLARADFELVASRGLAASSMKANPIALTLAELVGVLEAAW